MSQRVTSLLPVGAISRPASPAFDQAVTAVSDLTWRPELIVDEIPPPQRIAPHSYAVSADVEVDDEELGNGRLVLLHDPAGNPAWDGTFRCVTFARASVDTTMALDPLLADVGWSWLLDALERHSAAYTAPSGTVTSVSSRSFGSMEDDPERAEVEIRASWTPLVTSGHEMVAHLRAWEDLLCMVAGLPSLPEGVVPMPLNRSARRRR